MVAVRGRIGGNLGTGLVFGRNVGGGAPLRAGDVRGIVGRFRTFAQRVLDQAPHVTKAALEPTFDKSQIYCPKKTGELVGSGYLEITGKLAFARGGAQPVVEMGYGRNGIPYYALIVHEVMTYYHAPPTRAKWLQTAMQEDFGKILPKIANQLKV